MKKVAIVIPIYKEFPSEYEILSLERCLNILKKHPMIFAHPTGMNLQFYQKYYDVEFRGFNSKYFDSIEGYNKLLLSRKFYRSFDLYEYILIYQLDAYVFKDDLIKWCNLGYDYCGGLVYNFEEYKNIPVYNGGFSLRNVNASLRILSKFSKIYTWSELLERIEKSSKSKILVKIRVLYFYLFRNNTFWLLNGFDRNEDIFWSSFTIKNNLEFRVVEKKLANSFSIDTSIKMDAVNFNNDIVFGCHAYHLNTSFWNQYIDELKLFKTEN